MRLRKAEYKRITFALFVIVVALMFIQCIFAVGGVAEAESEDCRALISDYFSFNAPTRIAACGEDFAVFDAGRIVLFHDGASFCFDTETEECDKLVLSDEAVYLLTGLAEGAPHIYAYSLDGMGKEYVIPSEKVTDISFAEGKLYTLSSLLTVKGYTADGLLAESYELPGMNFSIRFAAEEGRAFFRKYDGSVIKREGETVTSLESIGEVTVLSAMGGKLYYAKDGEIRVLGGGVLLPKENASGDALFSGVTDFAVGHKIFVLDGDNHAVKVYDTDGNYQKMIGAAGSDVGRLDSPVALTVKGGKILVADSLHGSEFSTSGIRVLKGREVKAPTDVALTDSAVYLADKGILYEYNASLTSPKDHSYFSSSCRFVTASPNGTVYAATGKDLFARKADESRFSKLLSVDSEITGMTVGIGGNILYLLSGNVISAYAESGVCIAQLDSAFSVKGFSVDYRGNVYVASQTVIRRYERIPQGYGAPTSVATLPAGYASYGDLALDETGSAYVLADHNVLVYTKDALNVAVRADGAFEDNEPAVAPLFICEITKDAAVAYVSPGNFEDIAIVPVGTRLMCDAQVSYAGVQYVRAAYHDVTVYVTLGDVTVFAAGQSPYRQVRCLIPSIGDPVGVNLYKEPTVTAEILFSSLGKEAIFDVISVVAVDAAGKDAWGFYWVNYQGTEGYVRIDEVVSVDADPLPMPKTREMQVKSDGLGKTVSVYKEANLESEVIASLSDGSTIKVIEPFDQNNEFIMVLYEGRVCYVLSQNVGENGLSAGQVLAIVLSVVAAIGSVLTILILRANKKHKRNQKE